jgi:ppGpp synthetase/RelA/SpoT-type nucleotidyltranferase
VIGTIRSELGIETTGRPGKSTGAIVNKLARQRVRLSQMQDVAGCRLLVPDRAAQDVTVARLTTAFPEAHVVDRRLNPSYGYRAVHVIVALRRRSIEIQVRTRLQHLWAELSEKLADAFGNEVKYGQGLPVVVDILTRSSALVDRAETEQTQDGRLHVEVADLLLSFAKVLEESRKPQT